MRLDLPFIARNDKFVTMLDPNQCRIRQQRLLTVMQQKSLDAVVIGAPHHVYYFSGHLASWMHRSAFALFADGQSTLVSANHPVANQAVDQALSYEANVNATMPSDQTRICARGIVQTLTGRKINRLAMDTSAVSFQVAHQLKLTPQTIDDELFQMRRVKDVDELVLMQRANECTRVMYERAREIVRPGVSEIEVFTELQATAVKTADEPLTALLGNDFGCSPTGGGLRHEHKAKVGALYILDLGPAYRGYFADNCRTISIDRQPTDVQLRHWQALVDCLAMVQRMARPGVRCVEIYNAVDEFLRQEVGGGMVHHLGHGVGLEAHEYPHLNPRWDDVLIEGEVFTAEPGLYGTELKYGMRLENNYLVKKDGVENLTPYPLELA